MNEHLHFFQSFLRNPLRVGAVTPSSRELALKILENVDANERNVALEIGCGTGAITKYIEKIVPNSDSFIGIEIDKEFVKKLNMAFPSLKIICGDACQTEDILRNHNMGKVSYIISGLPFVVLPEPVVDGILREIDKLMDKGCIFRTFQYAHGYNLPPARRFRQRLEQRYGKVKRSPIILKNVPPAYVLTWNTL